MTLWDCWRHLTGQISILREFLRDPSPPHKSKTVPVVFTFQVTVCLLIMHGGPPSLAKVPVPTTSRYIPPWEGGKHQAHKLHAGWYNGNGANGLPARLSIGCKFPATHAPPAPNHLFQSSHQAYTPHLVPDRAPAQSDMHQTKPGKVCGGLWPTICTGSMTLDTQYSILNTQ